MNKWLYQKGGGFKKIYMFLATIRMCYHVFRGNSKKAKTIIYEHFNW